jgi:hypothetical protein
MTQNKFLKNETILQTLHRLNKQIKTEPKKQIFNQQYTKQDKIYNKQDNKYINDEILSNGHCLICEETIDSTRDCVSDTCENIFEINKQKHKLNHSEYNDDTTSYQSFPISNTSSIIRKKSNIETNSMLSLDNDENSIMFIKIISNLEDRINELEIKKKKKNKEAL